MQRVNLYIIINVFLLFISTQTLIFQMIRFIIINDLVFYQSTVLLNINSLSSILKHLSSLTGLQSDS